MGWLFSTRWNNREELREHLVNGNGVKTLKSCWKGNNLWTVGEYTYPDNHIDRPGRTILYVGLYLCAKHGKGMDGWGYKDMDESAGPNYYNCPLGYIEMVEAHEKANGYGPIGYAEAWRKDVRERLARSKVKLADGQRIKLYQQEYTVLASMGRQGYRIKNTSGDIYRMRCNQVAAVEILA